jgi:hypothetical protein
VGWIPGAGSGDTPAPAADQSMHFVENLPAGMGFSAVCGWSLHRVENRLGDLQFSAICMWLERSDGGRGTGLERLPEPLFVPGPTSG